MGKITLNEALKKASVKNDLQMFLGLDAQSELGGMTPERLAAVAGESAGNSVSINLQPGQVHNFRTYNGAILLISQSNYISVASLNAGSSNRGCELTTQNNNVEFFKKDTPNKINVYADETGWHIQNTFDSKRSVIYRLIVTRV